MKRTYEVDNGILASVPGEYIVQAEKTLPAPTPDGPQTLTAEVDADWLGRVRIRFEFREFRHYKMTNMAWVAVHAEAVEGTV